MSTPANVLEFYAQSNWGNKYHVPGPYYSGPGHHGFDLKTGGQAKAVPALRAGTVRRVRSYGSVGTSISIETAPGDFSGYSHLYGVRVAEGQWVQQGEILANVALSYQSPGSAWDGPHLHLTRGIDATCVVGLSVSDPEPLIRDVIGGGTGGGVPGGGGGTGGISVSVEQGKILQQVAARGGYQGVQDGIPGVNTWKGVQTVITDNGFYSGPVDGLPGPNTWKGVQNLAQLGGYGGPVDGFPGDQTYKGLQSWLSEPASPT
ncbi:peptidoglycan DD-metalloendopeptidase family protein, partial [Cryobacterium sp. MLB-32]|uniref:peptidoglycan DD-metalloendopeptidase family protein n=1 Tax=Cryobacterium sp. MLB-32 TaxID=1529318 RepID=UPI0018CD995C